MAGIEQSKAGGLMGLTDMAQASKSGGLKGFMDTLVSRQIDSGKAPVSRDQMDQLKSTGKKGMVQGLGGISNLADLIGGRSK